MVYTVKGVSIFKEAEIDFFFFLEFSCFFYDPMDVGILISVSYVLNPPGHLKVLSLCTAKAWLDGF